MGIPVQCHIETLNLILFISKRLPPKAMGRELELFLTEASENSATGNGKKKSEG